MNLIITCLASFFISAGITFFLIKFLKKRNILDIPGERSNHKSPIPRGAGLAVITAIIANLWYLDIIKFSSPFFFAFLLIVMVSLLDDIRKIKPVWRLAAQALALLIFVIPADIFSAGPGELIEIIKNQPVFVIIILAAGFFWLWFINLYNFMDGIDGITGVETISICIGLTIIYHLAGGLQYDKMIALITASATLGFLIFNWHPARIFLGDVGSIPLGFLVGLQLISLVFQGYWAAALILPGYYLADSGITIAKRIIKREKIWESHSQHFYQRAVRNGFSHSNVVLKIAVTNIILITIAAFVSFNKEYQYYGIAVSIFAIGILIHILKQKKIFHENT